MADIPNKPTINKPGEQVAKAKVKLEELKKSAMALVGKPGMNPFIFVQREINPLEAKLEAGDTSQETLDKIFSLEIPKSTPVKILETNPKV